MTPRPQQRRPQVIAHHLIWTLYGHWLPNDPRGSGSSGVSQKKLTALGAVHHGRKPPNQQPSRGELRAFYRRAEPLLEHKTFWLNDQHRQVLATALGATVRSRGYTGWAAAVLANHVHMVVRKHRDDALTMWRAIAIETRAALHEAVGLDQTHPVWADRPYKVYLCTPDAVRSCVRYVEQNPVKEGVAPQRYDWLKEYNGWPFHKK